MSDAPARLEFDHVAAAAPADGGAPLLHDAAFRLAPGGLLWLGLDDAPALAPLCADLAQGLEEPAGGTVRCDGTDWRELPAARALAIRGGTGRIHAGPAWLSNLDLDENILLPLLHHTSLPAAELRTEADAWARRLGLPGLPHSRPAWATPRERQIGQWVRAVLGPPALLLVEDPEARLARGLSEAEAAAVAKLREGGAAVLWLAPRGLRPPAALAGAQVLELVDGRTPSVPEVAP